MIRICLTGVESTGKSTMAPLLAAHFGGAVMPEFGREWAETRGTNFTREALYAIAVGHVAARAYIEARHPAFIIEDTDIVMTSAWARMLHGAPQPDLTAIEATADLYLLFAADTPWVDDGTRQFGGRERKLFDAIISDELEQRGITPVIIAGTWAEREATAIAAVTALLCPSLPTAEEAVRI